MLDLAAMVGLRRIGMGSGQPVDNQAWPSSSSGMWKPAGQPVNLPLGMADRRIKLQQQRRVAVVNVGAGFVNSLPINTAATIHDSEK